MRRIKEVLLFAFFVLLLFSCSTKKDAFLNRNFHAVTTEFNVLYNGQVAFDNGLADIKNKYENLATEAKEVIVSVIGDDNISLSPEIRQQAVMSFRYLAWACNEGSK